MARLFYFIQPMNIIEKAVRKFLPNLFAEASSNEDVGFRPLGSSKDTKGLNQLTRDKQLKTVFAMYLKNGFAARILEIAIDFILGDEVTPDNVTITGKKGILKEDKIEQIKEVIENFHTINDLDTEFERMELDKRLNGMLIIPAFVNKFNGEVKLGFVDPTQLDTVITNPLNVKEILKLKFKSSFGGPSKILDVIRKQTVAENPLSDQYNLLTGDTFYFAINNVSNQPEGVSDLLNIADLLNQLQRLTFNVLEGTRLANLFVLDVEIKGATKKKIEEWKKENPVPDGPVRWVHGDRVKQEIKSTGLKTTDNSQTIKLFKNFILACKGYPPMWFADGEDANKATSQEQGAPVIKKLKKQQKAAIRVLKTFYTYAIHQAILYKEGFNLTREELDDMDIAIKAPDLEVKDQAKLATVITSLIDALTKAISGGLITKESATKTFLNLIQNLGNDINIDAELAKLEKVEVPDPANVTQINTEAA